MTATETKQALTYDEACAKWLEVEGRDIPNAGLSEIHGSTWHLENVCGPLCTVTWNGTVHVAPPES